MEAGQKELPREPVRKERVVRRGLGREVLAVLVFASTLVGPSFRSARAADAPAATDSSGMREESIRVPIDASPESPTLQTTLFEPTTTGKHPLVIFSHGTPRSSDGLQSAPWKPVAQARWFVDRGFAVAIPMRRGYAMSTGKFSEGFGECTNPDYVAAGRAGAVDLRAAFKVLAARPEIDASRTLLLGHSGGGFASLAFASEEPSIAGVLNFAGGRGSVTAGAVCSPDRLAAAMKIFGATTKAPSLWLYAENDTAFSPFIAKLLYTSFGGEAKNAKLVTLPAFKTDGHQVVTDPEGMALWTAPVSAFLAKLKLGTAPSATK